MTENAFAGLRFLRNVLRWPLDSILIQGRSIGCGPAISLAARYQVSGVITISPMLSFKELCTDVVGGPVSWLLSERFPNKGRMEQVRSPLLVVHGQQDKVIPCRHGMELFQVCRTRKLLVCPLDMGHNTNLFADVTFMVQPMLQFFALPDYCFEEIVLPSWVYDRESSAAGVEPAVPPTVPNAIRSIWHPGERHEDSTTAGKDRLALGNSSRRQWQTLAYPQQAVAGFSPSSNSAAPPPPLPASGASPPTEATPPAGSEEPKPEPKMELPLLQRSARQPPDVPSCLASRSRLQAISDEDPTELVSHVACLLVPPDLPKKPSIPEDCVEVMEECERHFVPQNEACHCKASCKLPFFY